MADLAITATQVIPSAQAADLAHGLAGEALAIGDSVYRSAADQRFYKARATTVVLADATGIAVTAPVAAAQPVVVQHQGDMTIGAGAAVAAGDVLAVSANAGKIAPVADLVSTNFTTLLAVGIGSNKIRLRVFPTGVAKA